MAWHASCDYNHDLLHSLQHFPHENVPDGRRIGPDHLHSGIFGRLDSSLDLGQATILGTRATLSMALLITSQNAASPVTANPHDFQLLDVWYEQYGCCMR